MNMAGDLNYFYERKLDRTNLEYFHNRLPPRLRDKLKDSVHAKICPANVLQGYRGPSNMCNGGSGDSGVLKPSNGLQEIRFWWGYRKDVNYIPIYGAPIYGIARSRQYARGELDWSSLYFDEKTGECLSHDKDEAAEKLNSIGLRLYNDRKYEEAAEYHNNAYKACSKGYYNEHTFKKDAHKAESKLEVSSSSDDD